MPVVYGSFHSDDNTSAALETDHRTPLHLLISYPTAFDQVDPEKSITDAQYICLMTASVNSSGTQL